jgi:hypothetical protein
MSALDPAAMYALAKLFVATAVLIRAIWPNGVFK